MCIYRCIDPALARRDPHKNTPEEFTQTAHVFPEAVISNQMTFPAGFLCDACNRSFGQNLEPHLAYHPGIASDIQEMDVTGKNGLRQRVANIERDALGGALTVPVVSPQLDGTFRGRPVLKIVYVQDPRFDAARFRRAIHMIAFNRGAFAFGVEAASDPVYDDLRRYVRWPRVADEEWPFAEVYDRANRNCCDVGIEAISEFGQIATIRIFSYLFYVDLLNKGQLRSWLEARRVDGARLVEPGERYLRSPTADELEASGTSSMQLTWGRKTPEQ
jgi:hypothetical protein